MQKRKLKIDEEEVDIKSEIEDIQSQVSHFQFKKQSESSFQKKQTNKPEGLSHSVFQWWLFLAS